MINRVRLNQQDSYNVIVTDPHTLDFKSVTRLQQTAFANIIEKTGTGYLFTEPYYRWKYSAPAGDAKIALIHDDEGLVAVNAMYPLDLLADSKWIRGWQLCDIATHPRGRKKGYFVRCIDALSEKITADDLLFCYPNQASKPGLIKCGWIHLSNVKTWMSILPQIKVYKSPYIEQIEKFTTEHDFFVKKLSARGGVILDRNSIYMNWRYNQHPFHQYEMFAWRENGHLSGIIVLRKVTILGKELAIVLEILALSARVERGLLAFAASWGKEHKTKYTLALNNTTSTLTGILSAYIPVPMWALPKRQILMGTAAANSQAQLACNRPWRIQIGDWDGF